MLKEIIVFKKGLNIFFPSLKNKKIYLYTQWETMKWNEKKKQKGGL